MARIQILELPTIYREHGDDETPFAIVIDQVPTGDEGAIDPASDYSNVAQQLGARAVMVFHDTVEIPANTVTLDDGQVVRLKIEPDLSGFNEAVEASAKAAELRLSGAIRAGRWPT